jgi:hypothetical protein
LGLVISLNFFSKNLKNIHEFYANKLFKTVNYILLIVLFLGFSLNVFGQDSLSKAIQFNVLSADILPHAEDIRKLSYSNPFGFSAAYIWQNWISANK